MKNKSEKHWLNWNGILLEIHYEPLWLPAHVVGEDTAYLHVKSIYPAYAPLPNAENGHYQATPSCATIAAAGGPVNFIDTMLAAEADA